MQRLKLGVLILFALFGVWLLFTEHGLDRTAHANSAGPPAGYSRAPGEEPDACAECHLLTDAGSGTIRVEAPQSYVPGQSYQVTVRHTNADPTRVRWGFQLTALDESEQRAGHLEPLDGFTQVLNNQGPFPARQYIEHTSAGTFPGRTGGAAWTFRWTAPATNVGVVSFYAAGNHANGDQNTSGDYIYFTFASTAFQPPSPNPIDETAFFVRQQYLDFLNREPDASGLNFWTNEIEGCGANAQCREVKRINVSAAFFLSIEFQETGYLVYRLYVESFDRQPRHAEFMADVQEIGRGVVVGQGDWEEQLAANRRSFADAWVARAAFRAAYDQLSNREYVDKLYANARLTASASERDSLVSALDSGAKTRARVLLDVAESASFKTAELNRAFVLMEYFGYLRRNPDDPPDNNFSGYDFWLGKLNEFGGNFVRAEMVKAFINSDEYRKRFGQ